MSMMQICYPDFYENTGQRRDIISHFEAGFRYCAREFYKLPDQSETKLIELARAQRLIRDRGPLNYLEADLLQALCAYAALPLQAILNGACAIHRQNFDPFTLRDRQQLFDFFKQGQPSTADWAHEQVARCEEEEA